MANIRKEYIEYLKSQGYKEYTKNDKPSTVYDYAKRIDMVCQVEKISWDELNVEIDRLLVEYSKSGIKAHLGSISHSSIINALRRFKEFISNRP